MIYKQCIITILLLTTDNLVLGRLKLL